MKKLIIFSNVLLCIILILCCFYLFEINFSKDNLYDLNNDCQVDGL